LILDLGADPALLLAPKYRRQLFDAELNLLKGAALVNHRRVEISPAAGAMTAELELV
jgi:hypothetical protein